MQTKEKKRAIGYFTFLTGWVIALTVILAAALIWFYGFLKNYQKVYDETRPLLYQNEVMKLFEEKNAARILEAAQPVTLGPFEDQKIFEEFLNGYLEGKQMAFAPKKGEHIEERPVYVVTADEVPLAVVRLKKQAETAAYGLPLWETGSIELLPMETKQFSVLAPDTAMVTVNGIAVTKDALAEDGIHDNAEKYVKDYAQIPTYSRYDLGQFHKEPTVLAVNAAGESVDVTYDEKEHCYKAEFGGNQALQKELNDYVIQMATDYAMYVSNDAPENALDKYFPNGSKLLTGIKGNGRQYYDSHRRPEVKNEEVKAYTVYSPEAFRAEVYLEQHMYVPFSGKTEIVITDRPIYFVKINGEWKVAGIEFR